MALRWLSHLSLDFCFIIMSRYYKLHHFYLIASFVFWMINLIVLIYKKKKKHTSNFENHPFFVYTHLSLKFSFFPCCLTYSIVALAYFHYCLVDFHSSLAYSIDGFDLAYFHECLMEHLGYWNYLFFDWDWMLFWWFNQS